jgi:hypothetical protein
MTKLSSLLTILFSILLISSGNLHAANGPIVQDGGMDGGARILTIHCPAGSRTTVRLYVEEYKDYKPGQICIYKVDGSDMCSTNWDHDEAAVEACNQK